MSDTPLRRLGSTRDTSRGEAFAALLVKARRDLGWTQDDLIFRSGVSRGTISRWEAGRASTPNPDHVRAVCAALGIDQRDALLALGYLTTDELAPAA